MEMKSIGYDIYIEIMESPLSSKLMGAHEKKVAISSSGYVAIKLVVFFIDVKFSH